MNNDIYLEERQWQGGGWRSWSWWKCYLEVDDDDDDDDDDDNDDNIEDSENREENGVCPTLADYTDDNWST